MGHSEQLVRRHLSKQNAVKVCKACGGAGLWILRGAALGGAVLSGVAILLFAMLGQDGISLGPFRQSIEFIIAEKAGAKSVSVGQIHLLRDGDDAAPFRIRVTDIVLDQGDGTGLSVPGLSIRLDSQSLFRGQAMPRYIEVTGAELVVERGGDGLSMGGRAETGSSLDFGQLTEKAHRAGFEGAIFRNLSLRYRNRLTGGVFNVDGATATLRSREGVYAFRLFAPYAEQGGSLTLDLTASPAKGGVEAVLSMERVPADAILPLFIGERGGLELRAPVSGTLTAEGNPTDGFTSMGIALFVGEGELVVGERPTPVQSVTIDGVFDPRNLHLRIDRLDVDASGNKASMAGEFSLEANDGAVETVPFTVAARDVLLDPDNLFEAPLPLSEVRAVGRLDLIDHVVHLDHLTADYFGAQVHAEGDYFLPEEPEQSPGIRAEVAIDGAISPQEVLKGWPPAFGDGARDWIARSLPAGDIVDVIYTMDIPRGGLGEKIALTAEQLDLNFTAKNATVIYVPGMTPIRGLSAKGRLQGNRFDLEAEGGRVGKVRVRSGSVEMARLVPNGGMGIFTATVEGPVPDILNIINEPPLHLLQGSGFTAEQFSGPGQFTIEVQRPMRSFVPRADYRFSGHGTFTEVEARDLIGGVAFSQGDGRVTLTGASLEVEGRALAEDIPANFTFIRRFGGERIMSLFADAVLDARAADALGLPFRRFVDGAIDLSVAAQGRGGSFDRVQIKGDLTKAALSAEGGDVIKPAGADGELFVDIDLDTAAGAPAIEALRLSAGGLDVAGNARFAKGQGLVDLEIPRLFIERYADLSLRLRREKERLVLNLDGDYLYLGSLVGELMSGKKGPPLPEISFDAHFNRVELKGGVTLEAVNLEGDRGATGTSRLDGDGTFSGGGDIALSLSSDAAGLGRQLIVRTGQVGALLRGLFGITSVQGGDGELQATLLDNGELAGSFVAEGLTVQDAPTVARLLSVGSLDGLANVLNGEGLSFDELTGDVQVDDGVLRFVNVRLTGDALGLSANGDVDLNRREIAIHGAIAPAYQVNSFVGGIPGVGNLLVSRKGEGVFALAYSVDGPAAGPTITVNSLAALAPGVLRRIFEPVARNRPTTQEILDAADEAARDEEAERFLSTPELLQEHESSSSGRGPRAR